MTDQCDTSVSNFAQIDNVRGQGCHHQSQRFLYYFKYGSDQSSFAIMELRLLCSPITNIVCWWKCRQFFLNVLHDNKLINGQLVSDNNFSTKTTISHHLPLFSSHATITLVSFKKESKKLLTHHIKVKSENCTHVLW